MSQPGPDAAVPSGFGDATVMVIAAVAGLAVGAATSGLQTILPAEAGPLANSGAPWTLAAMIIVIAIRRTGWRAGALGTLAMLGEVAGYYATSALRGFAVGTFYVIFWTVAALVAGAASGVAAAWLRDGGPSARVAGIVLPAGILAGEGFYLWHGVGVAELEPYGIISLATGAAGGIIAIALAGRTITQRLAGIAGIPVVAVALYSAYMVLS
ncbi:hypothetical protein Pth03_80000 [Planotetraspora thailandica]|uniref:Uncharacterized protein n=1 Tax=Planotetraspora thailandica TaxID=487172 RepID=A0A8J4DFQ1_9ACTN|nr:DUF6518 family protein [Planotetraspora thailandica]GII59611.1 hypothetical protein Pth03_80000 [Planotetraspora thailandica]